MNNSVAIVVEWENVLLCEKSRCRRMLAEIRDQINGLKEISLKDDFFGTFSFPLKVYFVFDELDVAREAVEQQVGAVLKDGPLLRLFFCPAQNKRYYELKNFGGKMAEAAIIVFLDSDVIPQPRWLQDLLTAFRDPKVEVVGGNAFIEPENLYAKAFALGWFFPLKAREARLEPARHFFANNVAFRKEIFLRFPFPEEPRSTRGSCSRLARTLNDRHIGFYKNSGAQVSHPAPNGVFHFFVRGLAEGRDQMMPLTLEYRREAWILKQVFYRFWGNLSKSFVRVCRQRKEVDLGFPAVPLAVFILWIYYTTYFFGEILTFVAPAKMAKIWQI